MRNNNKRPAHWPSVLEAFRVSGLSQQKFCAQEGIALSTFCHRKSKAEKAAPEAQFIELDFLQTRQGSAQQEVVPQRELVVELPFGVVLRFRGVSQ